MSAHVTTRKHTYTLEHAILAILITLTASLTLTVAPSVAAGLPVIGQQLPVSAITRTTATVSSGIDPEGAPTTCRVLYGVDGTYGRHTLEIQVGEDTGGETVNAGLTGLTPGTTYHYQFVATNTNGTVTGPDETFTTSQPTPPSVTTGGASNITLTAATVSGTVGPEGLESSYELDLGTDASYGTSIYGEAGGGREDVPVPVSLQDLAPGATYHYRFVAINSDGRTYGTDQAFTTPAYSKPLVLPPVPPLLQAPAIAFPTETANTGKPTAKKTTKKTKTKSKKKNGRHAKKAKPKRKK